MYDIIIVGAGPAGMTAAVYSRRAGKKTLMIDENGFGGQIINTPEIENYPGIANISGMDFSKGLYEQAMNLGAEIKYERVEKIIQGDVKTVVTGSAEYETKSVILATGAKNRPLGIKDEEKFTGAGVSYCATCDGAFFRGREVAVVGGGNTALKDAEVLSDIASKVYLIHRRDTFRGDEADAERLKKKTNIEFVMESVPEELLGDNVISGLAVKNVKTGERRVLEVQGIFVAIGQMPDNGNFADVVNVDASGYIVAGENCTTGNAGIFVAGDCRTKQVRQLTTAAADGAVAALASVDYINKWQED